MNHQTTVPDDTENIDDLGNIEDVNDIEDDVVNNRFDENKQSFPVNAINDTNTEIDNHIKKTNKSNDEGNFDIFNEKFIEEHDKLIDILFR
jgi:hypothetical protein